MYTKERDQVAAGHDMRHSSPLRELGGGDMSTQEGVYASLSLLSHGSTFSTLCVFSKLKKAKGELNNIIVYIYIYISMKSTHSKLQELTVIFLN